jgi:hypothetical protein
MESEQCCADETIKECLANGILLLMVIEFKLNSIDLIPHLFREVLRPRGRMLWLRSERVELALLRFSHVTFVIASAIPRQPFRLPLAFFHDPFPHG